MAKSIIEQTGKVYGRWTVLSIVIEPLNGTGQRWNCRCSCGTERSVSGSELRGGRSQSCGCLRHEPLTPERLAKIVRHGNTGTGWRTSEYSTWNGMLQRCLNPKNTGFAGYGGRGITVCREWVDSFASFLEDMGKKPSPKHSIDRIDNNGPYCKENCRWATASEQQLNTSQNHRLTLDGDTLTISEWSKRLGVRFETIYGRIRRGLSVEDTLSTHVRPIKRMLTFKGETLSVQGWATKLGIQRATLSRRLNAYGWSVERTLTEAVNVP